MHVLEKQKQDCLKFKASQIYTVSTGQARIHNKTQTNTRTYKQANKNKQEC